MSAKLNKKIKLLFVLYSMKGGGAERQTLNLLKKLSRNSFDISLFLFKKSGIYISEIPKDISVYTLESESKIIFNVLKVIPGILPLLFLTNLLGVIKKINSDIVISRTFTSNIITGIIAKLLNSKKTKFILIEVSVPHRAFMKYPGRLKYIRYSVGRIAYKNADYIVSISKEMVKDIVIFYGITPMRIINIPLGIDLEDLTQKSTEMVTHSWLFEKIPIVVGMGRLIPLKGFDYLLRAVAKAKRRRELRLLIFGEGYMKDELSRLAKRLKIENSIEFMGFVSNPYKYISKCDIFVFPSLYEGMGNSLLEAMSLGIPVVSANCPSGPKEIIENVINGILVSTKDSKAIERAIEKILDSHELRSKLSKKAKETIKKKYSLSIMINRYEELFLNLVSDK